MHQRRTIRSALRSFKKNGTLLKEWVCSMRANGQIPRKLLKNLLIDCHCHENAFQELLNVCAEIPVKALLYSRDWNGLKERFNNICTKNKFQGEPIKPNEWGKQCYRVVWLRYFADSLREKIAENFTTTNLENLGPSGNAFVQQIKIMAAITRDEQAIKLIKHLREIPIDDRSKILSLINLSNTKVVWASPAYEIAIAFDSQDSTFVRDVILRLGKPYLGMKALLLQYAVAKIDQRKIKLRFPTPFDVGWDQGYFVPSKAGDLTGWTVSLISESRGFPEGVHENTDCSLIEPSLIFY